MESNNSCSYMTEENIAEYADGELLRKEAEKVAAHLDNCPICRQAYKRIKDLKALTLEAAPTAPPNLHEKIMGAVKSAQKAEERKKRIRKISLFAGAGIAAMICLFVAQGPFFTGMFSAAEKAENGQLDFVDKDVVCEDEICAPGDLIINQGGIFDVYDDSFSDFSEGKNEKDTVGTYIEESLTTSVNLSDESILYIQKLLDNSDNAPVVAGKILTDSAIEYIKENKALPYFLGKLTVDENTENPSFEGNETNASPTHLIFLEMFEDDAYIVCFDTKEYSKDSALAYLEKSNIKDLIG